MIIKQLSVFLENRSGRIHEIAKLLGDANINIRALSLADSADFGVMRIIADKLDDALACLRKHQIATKLTSVIAVEVPDRPGGLAQVRQSVANAKLNIEYMYSIPEKKHDNAIMIMRIENIEEAILSLADSGVNILRQDEVLNR